MIEFEMDIPWLWMVVLVAAVLLITLSRRRQLNTRRLVVSTMLRLATVFLVCLALANPIQRTVNPGRQNILFLIDRSDSIDQLGHDHSLVVMRDVQRLQQIEDLAGFMSFATETVMEAPLIRGFEAFTPKSSVATDATDIASAVEQGLASLPRNGENTIVLMSDGNETVRSTRSVVEAARRQGVAIHTVPLVRAGQEDWSVDKISAPQRVNAGERFNIRALLMNETDTPIQARISMRRNGQPINDEKSVTLPNGTTPISMVYKITEPGLHALDARITHEDGTSTTTIPTYVDVAGTPQILVIGPDSKSRSFFGTVLQNRNFEIEERPDLPASLGELLKYDCIILNDVGPDVLPDQKVQLLQRYTQDFGGGLVTIGGGSESSLEAFAQTSLEDLLPVTLARRHTINKKRKDFVLMLLIDRSGSMEGEKMEMAKASAINAIQGLEEGDSVGIIAFDDKAHWVVDLTVLGTDKTGVIDQVRALAPGGGTDARTALVEAYRVFSSKRINIRKHIILMTDGITTQRQLMEITQRIADREITISTIAIGLDSNIAVLDEMRTIGSGEFHLITDFSELPNIVVGDMDEQVKDADDIQERFTPEIFHNSPVINGIKQNQIPSLKGYVSSTLKVSASKPLMTNFKNTEDPILAHWYYGLGRSTAMLSGVNSSWSEDWTRWREFGRLWEQIIRWTKRNRSPNDYLFTIRHDGNRLHVRVEVDGLNQAIPTGLRGALQRPGQNTASVKFERSGGRVFEGAFAVSDTGQAHLALLEEGSTDRTMWFGSVYLPGVPTQAASSTELDGRPPNHRLLQDIASATGGIFDPSPNDIVKAQQDQAVVVSLRNQILLLVTLLFLIDIAVRRLDFPIASLWQRLRTTSGDLARSIRNRYFP